MQEGQAGKGLSQRQILHILKQSRGMVSEETGALLRSVTWGWLREGRNIIAVHEQKRR